MAVLGLSWVAVLGLSCVAAPGLPGWMRCSPGGSMGGKAVVELPGGDWAVLLLLGCAIVVISCA